MKLIVGDLHIGNSKSSEIFHKITVDYADWILSICAENKQIDEIILLGDIFHNRTAIALPSLNAAYQFFHKLIDYDVTIFPGNHDAFYLDNSDIHSLDLFKQWRNMTVIDKPTLRGNIFFAPWGTKSQEIQESKILLGHFETLSFEMSKGKVCTHGIKAADLMQKCQVCFSGHFHKNQERKYSDGKRFIYVGSAFQLNWGESGNNVCAYMVDADNPAITHRIDNTKSPRFEYINSEKDFDKIENNFVHFNIDDESKKEAIVSKLTEFKPLMIKTTVEEKSIKDEIQLEIDDFKGVEIEDVFEECISQINEETVIKELALTKSLKLLSECRK